MKEGCSKALRSCVPGVSFRDTTVPDREPQVLFEDGKFQWARLENLLKLAKSGASKSLDLSSTIKDAVRVVLLDDALRLQLVAALTEGNRLHLQEVASLASLVGDELDVPLIVRSIAADMPSVSRQMVLSWADRTLAS